MMRDTQVILNILENIYINDERYTVILNILENISMVHQSGILLPFFFEKDRHITLFRFPKKDAPIKPFP
jgi:hypothetical protein